MAKVKAPLLSLGASGKLAGTLVASTWKGIKTMREYVVPANPRTADQVTERNNFTACVSTWRNYIISAVERAAWNVTALASGKPQSGFNSFMSSARRITLANPDASYSNGAVAGVGNIVTFTMVNADDGAVGDEVGTFEVWAGNSSTSLLLINNTQSIAVGVLDTTDLGDTGDIKYVKIRKDDYDRSGIVKVTLVV